MSRFRNALDKLQTFTQTQSTRRVEPSSAEDDVDALARSVDEVLQILEEYKLERDRADRDARASEKKLHNILSASPIGISIYDASGRCLSANESLARIVGTTREELLLQSGKNIVPRKVRGIQDEVTRTIDTQTATRCEMVAESDVGENIVLDCHLVPLGAGGLLFMARDITERRRAENELRMCQFSIDQMSLAVFFMNMEAGFHYVNEQACRSLGYSRKELLNLKLWNIDPIYPKSKAWNGRQCHAPVL